MNEQPEQPTTHHHVNTWSTKRSRRRTLPIVAAAILVLGLSFGLAYAGSALALKMGGGTVTTASTINSAATDGNAKVTQEEANISTVASKVSPSVVSIVSQTQASAGSTSGLYNYLYGGSSSGGQASESAGTGIIVSKDGYIMTNKHVIDGASSVQVTTSDGTTYKDVTIIGSDPLNDLAFVKIKNVTNLTPAVIGDSATVRIGQQVVAIGNALGQYQNSVTSGIISGAGRPVTATSSDGSGSETLDDLLQTDAAINSGNSGGPLVNYSGQVIGINTAVASNAQSIGFAIPIDATKGVLKGVLANGTISRAYLGVSFVNITPTTADQYSLSVKKGAYIYASNGSAIVSGSPAASAGLKDKDIVTKVNGSVVGDDGGLSSILAQYTPGETVTLTVLRDGKTMDIKVTLTKYNG